MTHLLVDLAYKSTPTNRLLNPYSSLLGFSKLRIYKLVAIFISAVIFQTKCLLCTFNNVILEL